MRRRHRLAPLLVTSALVLVACGEDEDNPLQDGDTEIIGGAVGPEEQVSEAVALLQVQIEYPQDGVYEKGEDASLYFGISNTGTEPVTLVDITGEDFADASSADGSGVSIDVAADDNVYVGAEGMPSVTLEDLQRPLRSSQSIPVTFVFEEAGEVTVDAMVAASGQNPTPTVDFQDPAEDPSGDG